MSNLVEIRNLTKDFPIKGGVLRRTVANVRAVDNVSFDIAAGEAVGLVGESGCGKTTLGRMLVRLLDPTAGTINFEGSDIAHAEGNELKRMRQKVQMIFQDPFSSLDPRSQVGDSIAEGLKIHGIGDADERHERVLEMLDIVGLEPYHARRFPHEFSGGQRQRIGIARALILKPDFVVADEPVSALDVSVQAQVLNLLRELQRELSLTLLFIAHNLAVVEHVSDRVAVMYLGKIVEMTDRDTLYRSPQHPYTQALLSAIPIPDPTLERRRIVLQGDVPSPLNPPPGCRFHPRCPIAVEGICNVDEPQLLQAPAEIPHTAACHLKTGDHQHLDPQKKPAG
jgi:oligopeptide/dipeptide ABC transporter ATP-binding protein